MNTFVFTADYLNSLHLIGLYVKLVEFEFT